jgi:hypothetical protein
LYIYLFHGPSTEGKHSRRHINDGCGINKNGLIMNYVVRSDHVCPDIPKPAILPKPETLAQLAFLNQGLKRAGIPNQHLEFLN